MRLAIDIGRWSMDALLHMGEVVTSYNVSHPAFANAPLLYDTGVVYQLDPEDEPWMTFDQVYARGAGDCEDLGGWRAAELRARGWRALRAGDGGFEEAQRLQPSTIRAWADVLEYPGRQYHVVAHYEVGGVIHQDDPSARLGMRLGNIDPAVLDRWNRAGVRPKARPRWV